MPNLSCAQRLTISTNSKSNYKIIIPKKCNAATKFAANELQLFIKEISSAELPIITDNVSVSDYEILLGQNTHLDSLNISTDFVSLSGEDYMLKTAGNYLVITGGEVRGILYGVYGLLEKHLGCRWFTKEVSYIPRHDTLLIPPLNEKVKWR